MLMSALKKIDELIHLFGVNAIIDKICKESEDVSDRIETVELMKDCILLRNAFCIDEQYELYKAILKASMYCKQTKNRNCQVTQLMKITITNKHHQCRISPIYDILWNRTFQVLCSNYKDLETKIPNKDSLIMARMKALNYRSPNGCISRHCDNEKGWVILYSIGCTANFFVGYKTSKVGIEFGFNSGDILVFNSSKRSGIWHGVDSVVSNSCPTHLLNKNSDCHKLQNVRISLQTRCHMVKNR